MADNNDTAAKLTAKQAQEALEKQVAQMKREISKLNKALAERAEEAVDQANGWYSGATDRASRATQALRSQASSVSEAVRENPGTVSSAVLVGGLVGFMLGMLVGQSSSDSSRHHWR